MGTGGFVTHLFLSRSELGGQIIYSSPDRFVPISFENVPSGLFIEGYFQKEGKLVSLLLIIVHLQHFVCPRNVRQAFCFRFRCIDLRVSDRSAEA